MTIDKVLGSDRLNEHKKEFLEGERIHNLETLSSDLIELGKLIDNRMYGPDSKANSSSDGPAWNVADFVSRLNYVLFDAENLLDKSVRETAHSIRNIDRILSERSFSQPNTGLVSYEATKYRDIIKGQAFAQISGKILHMMKGERFNPRTYDPSIHMQDIIDILKGCIGEGKVHTSFNHDLEQETINDSNGMSLAAITPEGEMEFPQIIDTEVKPVPMYNERRRLPRFAKTAILATLLVGGAIGYHFRDSSPKPILEEQSIEVYANFKSTQRFNIKSNLWNALKKNFNLHGKELIKAVHNDARYNADNNPDAKVRRTILRKDRNGMTGGLTFRNKTYFHEIEGQETISLQIMVDNKGNVYDNGKVVASSVDEYVQSYLTTEEQKTGKKYGMPIITNLGMKSLDGKISSYQNEHGSINNSYKLAIDNLSSNTINAIALSYINSGKVSDAVSEMKSRTGFKSASTMYKILDRWSVDNNIGRVRKNYSKKAASKNSSSQLSLFA